MDGYLPHKKLTLARDFPYSLPFGVYLSLMFEHFSGCLSYALFGFALLIPERPLAREPLRQLTSIPIVICPRKPVSLSASLTNPRVATSYLRASSFCPALD